MGGTGLYCATKHAVRCISEGLHEEISPLGLRSLIFEPGYFRTDLLIADNRANYSGQIPDYEPIIRPKLDVLDGSPDLRSVPGVKADGLISAANHNQAGDAKKGAHVIIDVVKGEGAAKNKPFPLTVLLGSDCYEWVKNVLTESTATFEEWKDVTVSTDRDDVASQKK